MSLCSRRVAVREQRALACHRGAARAARVGAQLPGACAGSRARERRPKARSAPRVLSRSGPHTVYFAIAFNVAVSVRVRSKDIFCDFLN